VSRTRGARSGIPDGHPSNPATLVALLLLPSDSHWKGRTPCATILKPCWCGSSLSNWNPNPWISKGNRALASILGGGSWLSGAAVPQRQHTTRCWRVCLPGFADRSPCTVALVDRLTHRADIVHIERQSWRRKEAQERQARSRGATP